jgi:hypothetical protein
MGRPHSTSPRRSPRRDDAHHDILIRVRDNVADVTPAPPEVIDPLREVPRVVSQPGGPRGVEAGRVVDRLGWDRPGGGVRILAGLVPRVAAALRRAGHTVEVVDLAPPCTRLEADSEWLERQDDATRAPFAAIEQNRRGQIAVPAVASKPASLVTIVTAFPTAHITVVVATRQRARSLGGHLRHRLGEPVTVAAGAYICAPARLRIAIPAYKQPADADLVIFESSDSAVNKVAVESLEELDRPRLAEPHVYGFTTGPVEIATAA